LNRALLLLRHTQAGGPILAPPSSPIAIVGGPPAVANALVHILAERGVIAETGPVSPATAAVICLTGLSSDGAAIGNAREAHRIAREAFDAARAFAPRAEKEGGLLLTVQDTGGDFGLAAGAGPRAWAASLPGLVKTAAVEWPAASCKALDIATAAPGIESRLSPQVIAQRIADEVMAGGADRLIAIDSAGCRWTPEDAPCRLDRSGPPSLDLSGRPVVVVSGGGRGITATATLALAAAAPLRLVLLGRTVLTVEPAETAGLEDAAAIQRQLMSLGAKRGEVLGPRQLREQTGHILAAREIRRTLAALAARGSEAVYRSLDAADAAAVATALAEIRAAWGAPIAGIVHGAGVLADKRIAQKPPADFDRVFATKVHGLEALLRATDADPLRFIALFSSVAARYGNFGQCDYAMANEVLNHVARAEAARRGPACIVRSFNWGPWDGGMVTPALRELFHGRGIGLIGEAEGAAQFVDELLRGRPGLDEVDVMLGSTLVPETV